MINKNIDLAFQGVLNDSKPDMDIPIKTKKGKDNNSGLRQEADFSDAQYQDLISNRKQREEFTKQIVIIMCVELLCIGILILGVFTVPFINAFAPKLSINLPPVFLTITTFIAYFYFWITYKSRTFRSVITIALLIFLNYFGRISHEIHFTHITLSDELIHVILWTALAVFVKTTILAGYIIKGLYTALNQSYEPLKRK